MARRFALMALLVLAAATQIRLHASAHAAARQSAARQAAAERVEATPIKTLALLVDRAKNPARPRGPVALASR